MVSPGNGERIEILAVDEVKRTLSRLASQVLECVGDVDQLVLLKTKRAFTEDEISEVQLQMEAIPGVMNVSVGEALSTEHSRGYNTGMVVRLVNEEMPTMRPCKQVRHASSFTTPLKWASSFS